MPRKESRAEAGLISSTPRYSVDGTYAFQISSKPSYRWMAPMARHADGSPRIGNDDYPFIAHTPTMRVPGSITGTDKVYMATWAALLAVNRHNATVGLPQKIEQIVFPAMGAGFGGVPYTEVARQMAAAYKHYLSPPHRMDWEMVTSREKSIAYDSDKKVVR